MEQTALKPRGRQSKGMYILPSLFTTANMAMGYYAILQVMHATASEYWHLDNAAKAIGFAVLFDGLDGRIARMTGTSSDFGKELDSLADVIAFGVAPAMLAWSWEVAAASKRFWSTCMDASPKAFAPQMPHWASPAEWVSKCPSLKKLPPSCTSKYRPKMPCGS